MLQQMLEHRGERGDVQTCAVLTQARPLVQLLLAWVVHKDCLRRHSEQSPPAGRQETSWTRASQVLYPHIADLTPKRRQLRWLKAYADLLQREQLFSLSNQATLASAAPPPLPIS